MIAEDLKLFFTSRLSASSHFDIMSRSFSWMFSSEIEENDFVCKIGHSYPF